MEIDLGGLEFLLKEFDMGRRPILMLKDVTITLSKENGKGEYDLVHIQIGKMDIKKWVRKGESVADAPKSVKKNNQTAGEVPFAMFFAKKIVKMFGSQKCVGNVVAQKAALLDLAAHVEMRTGRLIKGWENDSHKGTDSMGVADIAKAINKKDRQARVILGDLITNGFINKHKDGYYLNREYVVRGKSWESDL